MKRNAEGAEPLPAPADVLAGSEATLEASLKAAESHLRRLRAKPQVYQAALGTCAAVLYRRPQIATAETAGSVCALLHTAHLPDAIYEAAGLLLRTMATTPAGSAAVEGVLELLGRPKLPGAVLQTAVEFVRYAADWIPRLLNLEAILDRAKLPHLRPCRTALWEAAERLLWYSGAETNLSTFTQLLDDGANEPFLKYVCCFTAARRDFPAAVRQRAAESADARFSIREESRKALGAGPRQVLVVHNIHDGQGDEIVRTVTLMQALLDFSNELEITVITGRCYLYSHPRVRPVDIRDREQTARALQQKFDAVVDYAETTIAGVNRDPDLEQILQDKIAAWRPGVVLASTKGHNRFVYHRAELNGRPVAEQLGIDRQRLDNTYETTYRLIAEFGWPLRCGQDPPGSGPVMMAIPWEEAATEWRRLTAANTESLPVAVLSPFGGAEGLKGYVRATLGELVLELGRLTDRYFVVALPNGQPWGTTALLEEAVSRLEHPARGRVAIAPDPARGTGAGKAPEADRVMRLFLYFIAYADLTVSVEGWAIHVAYSCGKAYRVLMMPHSHSAAWQPYVTTREQRIMEDTSVDGDEEWNPPLPLPPLPRKFTLLFLLREMGRSGGQKEVSILRAAASSGDRDIRLAAVRSLRQIDGSFTPPEWAHLLDDPCFRVRGAAAGALRELPKSVLERIPLRRDILEPYQLIAAERREWLAVIKRGEAARPAVETALQDEDLAVSREAGRILRMLDMVRGHAPPRTGIGERVRRLIRPATPPADEHRETSGTTVLILTPVKDVAGCIDQYCRRVRSLTYPRHLISIAFLESDSSDSTYADLERNLPVLREHFRRAALWKRDWGYHIAPESHRGAPEIQRERRTVLARSRNQLLFRALDDEDWVLWLDADVIDYPADIIEQLLATGKDIVQPHCVLDYGGSSFDQNAWRDKGRVHLDDLRAEGELVELDAVGGTMLLVRADLHRDGLIFPAFGYGLANECVRSVEGERETEGLGLMARDMGYRCWGMPHLEIRHRKW